MPTHTLARRLPLLLAVAAPFLTCWLVVATYLLPARLEPYVLDLSGTWKLQEGDGAGWAEPAYDDSGWGAIRLPGGYSIQGHQGTVAWVRKGFELPAALRDAPLLFTLGGTRSGRAVIFVNGHEVGRTDEFFRGLKGEVDGLEAWKVDRRVVRPGSNVLAIRFEWSVPGHDGMVDGRLFLGAEEHLLPYYLRASDTRRFFQQGSLAVFVFMLVLLGLFLGREADPARRALQRSTLFVVAAAALYLALRIGLSPLAQSSRVTFTTLAVSVVVVAWAMVEYTQQFCLERITRAGKLHRVICGVSAGAMVMVHALPPAASARLYQLFASYTLVCMLWVTVLTVATLLRRKRSSDWVFASTVLCIVGAGVVDVLTDLYVLQAPRLTAVAIINLGLCAGVLLLADFIQLSYVNETLSARLARTNAELEGALARAEDVARLKSALLEDRLATVGSLASGMAHEINNPMAYVTANLAFLSKQLPQLAQSAEVGSHASTELAELGEIAAESLDGAKRVNDIVRELKLFARGSGEEKLEAVDVRDVVRRSLKLALPELEYRARVVQELEEVAPVLGNESRLGHVCLNLLLNASKAMAEGDASRNALVVRTRPREDGWVVLEISDTGRGISPEEQGRLFDPFFTTRPAGEGKGMGLAVCHGIVKQLGGEIQVESVMGRGSLFRVVLPPHSVGAGGASMGA